MRQNFYEGYRGWGIYIIHDYNGYWTTIYAGEVTITLEFPDTTYENAISEAKMAIDAEMERLGL